MIDTILFDLDGTLLRFSQEAFVGKYIGELRKVFIELGLDGDLAVKALWEGTKSMVQNDGQATNKARFWDTFSGALGLGDERLASVEGACNVFYETRFDAVKSVVEADPSQRSRRLVRDLASRGYRVALATNPLFPLAAARTRLGWIGLSPEDFSYITHYENCTFSKPNLGYYREILDAIGKPPGCCVMVGNNVSDDMSAVELGAEAYLVTDFLENESGADVSAYRHGTFDELEAYLSSLPSVV